MPIGTVAHSHLPYCLQKTKDGKWLALNRNYKPLGTVGKDEWFDYDSHPSRQSIPAATISALKRRASSIIEDKPDDPGLFFFYDDRTMPTDGAANWKRYCETLLIWANASAK
ncbi:hypothetical protein LN565_15330 [Xanthomonas euvesicatoria pv. euvesicatoria]|uniref:Uncharacterized protein n=4 Tax=Xanthomonas TaxID=338 RepID=A0A8E4EX67_9XANT|nr:MULTISPECIES: hypothetical protein [Xanthomonas]WVK02515.1 hypothetical protein KWH09_12800 [Xanthomonas campestris pv. olitorii]SYZ57629.1 hypothetical protein CPBF367_39090 [Xanthomonas arboricola pv. juglandis]KLB52928.1 hypothetical protein XEUV354_22655 [Xanthomonas euvesicatoria]KLB66998.1 hypothetical protein XEUV490_17950 [Xanthomonas euvesicatoria]KLB84621.1 hypothetical protein XEUV526_12500 [Xanthomonas euvesicatoria]